MFQGTCTEYTKVTRGNTSREQQRLMAGDMQNPHGMYRVVGLEACAACFSSAGLRDF